MTVVMENQLEAARIAGGTSLPKVFMHEPEFTGVRMPGYDVVGYANAPVLNANPESARSENENSVLCLGPENNSPGHS